MKADARIMMIDNAARENRITMDSQAKRNELEQKQKKHDQSGQTPTQQAREQLNNNPLSDHF
ncbi:hypothetical protein BJP41_03895 [Candidatus Williamhamiltonella defendens]|uniref:Uncharacterized protein n=2 Tax=Candidatus Williamhamiltonella defendens TaxID=138072 RepID=A0A2D3T1G2_9ENTR|nr:hypothetical protein BJP41_03895 [Candidatus Hamiltonella defensa]ATW31613.1 hypothetical protein BJP42_03960 [Candidatus Hamiltonella defensa]